MAILYVDTDGSGASTPYNSWATAAQDLETAMEDAACVAGSTIYMQGAATDTKAAYTLTSAGTSLSPVIVVGVKDGTTNTGSSIVTSDLADRVSANMPTLATSSGNITLAGGITFVSIDIAPAATLSINSDTVILFQGCDITETGTTGLLAVGNPCNVLFHDCNTTVHFFSVTGNGASAKFYGGSLTTAASYSFTGAAGTLEVIGVDMSGSSSGAVFNTYNTRMPLIARNCRFKAGYSLTSGSWNAAQVDSSYVLAIGCGDGTSKANDASYQGYEYSARAGTVNNEGTIVRTGGATDGATGQFSYAMQNSANWGVPGSNHGIYSPWLSVWIAGGSSTTLTAYTTHDNAGTINRDLYENELQVEFYTPDTGDTPGYDYNTDPGLGRWVPGSTVAAGTDDTTSTWATHNTYKRSFSTTVTPGYTGWAYARARLNYSSATPVTVYLDGKLEVS